MSREHISFKRHMEGFAIFAAFLIVGAALPFACAYLFTSARGGEIALVAIVAVVNTIILFQLRFVRARVIEALNPPSLEGFSDGLPDPTDERVRLNGEPMELGRHPSTLGLGLSKTATLEALVAGQGKTRAVAALLAELEEQQRRLATGERSGRATDPRTSANSGNFAEVSGAAFGTAIEVHDAVVLMAPLVGCLDANNPPVGCRGSVAEVDQGARTARVCFAHSGGVTWRWVPWTQLGVSAKAKDAQPGLRLKSLVERKPAPAKVGDSVTFGDDPMLCEVIEVEQADYGTRWCLKIRTRSGDRWVDGDSLKPVIVAADEATMEPSAQADTSDA